MGNLPDDLYRHDTPVDEWLAEHGSYSLLQVLYQLEFRAFFSVVLSFLIVLCCGPRTIRWLSEGRIGQNVAFLALEGHVAALRANGELRIIAADPAAYRARAAYQVAPDQTWAPPVLLDRKILIKDLNRLTLWSVGS